ncbi:MAG: YigZ family protein [Ignavibacteriaceae bacterium]
MSLPDQIKTIDEFHEILFKEKGSEFIAQVYHIESSDDVDEKLGDLKKKFFDATHHCYAYKILKDQQKYYDDGEPSGSAGLRILNAIDHFNLINVLVVVIRYFGGSKLGVGPLGKAYYNSAYSVLSDAKIKERILFEKLIIKTEFSFISHIYRLTATFNGKIEELNYNNIAVYQVMIQPKFVNRLKSELSDLSGGKIEITIKNENIYQ